MRRVQLLFFLLIGSRGVCIYVALSKMASNFFLSEMTGHHTLTRTREKIVVLGPFPPAFPRLQIHPLPDGPPVVLEAKVRYVAVVVVLLRSVVRNDPPYSSRTNPPCNRACR
jgi:hypothetical protein